MGRRSAALTQNVPERVFSLVGLMICAADGPHLGRGWSANYLTVCTRDIVVSGGFQGRTADGPPANFKVVLETMFVSGGVEHITADGPPLGRVRSSRAVTASSDTH